MKSIPPVLLLLASLPAQAQQATTAAPATLPDIEFAADVHMRSVRFGSDPAAQVTFSGGPRLDTRHDVERDNLPRPVKGGTTYRDATVRTTISATLLDPAAAPASDTPPPDEDRP
ncbi:MAG TPA: hypothetical protein VIG88_13805 [Lysobacter sp.]